MIRAALVAVTFPISLYTHVSLFGWERGVIGAAALTLIVSFAAFGLWPEKRSNPVKIEPRLRPTAEPRFEIQGVHEVRTARDLMQDIREQGVVIIENSHFEAGSVGVLMVSGPMNEMLRDAFDASRPTSPIIEIHPDASSEILRDLAARVTPEMLALPIPTAVRALLNDLLDAGAKDVVS